MCIVRRSATEVLPNADDISTDEAMATSSAVPRPAHIFKIEFARLAFCHNFCAWQALHTLPR